MNHVEACCRVSRRLHRAGTDHTTYLPSVHGYGPAWLWIAVAAYLVLHLAAGHARHRLSGRRVNYGWSVLRGPWFSLRLTRHLRWRS
jgi:hypothetical protein